MLRWGERIVDGLVLAHVDELRRQIRRLLAQILRLLVHLEEAEGQVEQNQYEVDCGQRIIIDTWDAHKLKHVDKVAQGLLEQTEQVERVEEDEGQEVLVVPIAETIIDEGTVVVKMLVCMIRQIPSHNLSCSDDLLTL